MDEVTDSLKRPLDSFDSEQNSAKRSCVERNVGEKSNESHITNENVLVKEESLNETKNLSEENECCSSETSVFVSTNTFSKDSTTDQSGNINSDSLESPKVISTNSSLIQQESANSIKNDSLTSHSMDLDQCTGSENNLGNNKHEEISNSVDEEFDDEGDDISDVNEMIFARAVEKEVGITEFISDLPGFKAIIKKRYSDFLVNEINRNGEIVRLTDLSKPKNPEADFEVDNLLSQDIIDQIYQLESDEIPEVLIDVTNKDKNTRKEIHVALRQKYSWVESSTEDRDDKKLIVVKKFKKGKGKRFAPSVAGNYLHFVLYKENRDTINTINKIASVLRIPTKVFSYAGTKDKRGRTSQMVSAYRLSPERLLGINKQFDKIKIGNITFSKEQIKLGDLSGNHFAIILRELEASEELVEKAVGSLIKYGFINYFGMQRFGTSTITTHSLGRYLLLGKWKTVIDLLLMPKDEDDDDMKNAKTIWVETQNAQKAYDNLERRCSVEGKLLAAIAHSKERDYVNALNGIPRNMRLLYIHSYQSFIWNKVASKRIQTYGLKVLKGDLVFKKKTTVEESIEDNGESSSSNGSSSRKTMLTNLVKVLSENEVVKYSITDVLIPLPGHSIVMPENETKEWYEEFLKEDNMDWKIFDPKNKMYSLSGTYRRLVIIPQNVKWEVIPYYNFLEPLIPSDLDILQEKLISEPLECGSHKALKLEFDLPPSSYATMAIREVTKSDTTYVNNHLERK